MGIIEVLNINTVKTIISSHKGTHIKFSAKNFLKNLKSKFLFAVILQIIPLKKPIKIIIAIINKIEMDAIENIYSFNVDNKLVAASWLNFAKS